MSINITPRVLKEAKNQAALLSNRIKNAWSQSLLKNWADIEKRFTISIPPPFPTLPFTYGNLTQFIHFWVSNVEARLLVVTKKDEQKKTEPEKRLTISKEVSTFGQFTLFPEQESVVQTIHRKFEQDNLHFILQDGYTGSGKMIMGSAIIALAIKSGLLESTEVAFRLHPIIVLTPKGVAEKWRRTLEGFGFGKLVARRKIWVFEDTAFPTDQGRIILDEHEDETTGEISLKLNPINAPILIIVDEVHRFVSSKSYRGKCLESIIKSPFVKHILGMSATPMEKINESYLYALASGAELLGVRVTDKQNFKYFAGLLDAEPNKPNSASMKRLRTVLQQHIVSIPYTKPKHKVVNVIKSIPFRNDDDAIIYQSAHKRYLDACKKSGKNVYFGSFEKAVALQNFAKTVEPLRAYWMAKQMAEDFYSNQWAPVLGVRFKETITNVVFELVDKYHIPREQISLIWGGKKEYKTNDLLSQAELDAIIASMNSQANMIKIMNDRPLLKKVRLSLRYLQDKVEHSETEEAQGLRHFRLRELGLVGKQSDNQRQINIDNFQDGTAKICCFTLASGGIGLDLDAWEDALLARKAYFSMCYSGKEFKQAQGRTVRRASVKDALHYIVAMSGTVEEWHVAPILDEKLKCLAEITGRSFDVTNLLEKEVPNNLPIKLHNEEEAAKIAEADETNLVTDFESTNDEDEEDTDEVLTETGELKLL